MSLLSLPFQFKCRKSESYFSRAGQVKCVRGQASFLGSYVGITNVVFTVRLGFCSMMGHYNMLDWRMEYWWDLPTFDYFNVFWMATGIKFTTDGNYDILVWYKNVIYVFRKSTMNGMTHRTQRARTALSLTVLARKKMSWTPSGPCSNCPFSSTSTSWPEPFWRITKSEFISKDFTALQPVSVKLVTHIPRWCVSDNIKKFLLAVVIDWLPFDQHLDTGCYSLHDLLVSFWYMY